MSDELLHELLHVTDLVAGYGKQPVLAGVNFTLAAGEILTLIGPNGSGKSTLLRCLLGTLGYGGTVRWSVPARRVAYLPQTPSFAEGQTVAEAIELGRVPHLGWFGVTGHADRAAVRTAAERAGVADLSARRMETLSGGQRRLVFVARALAQEPAAILLDEPDAHLDYRRLAELHGLLGRLAGEKLGLIVASHDLNFAAALADRVLLMSDETVFGGPEILEGDRLTRAFGADLQVHSGGVRQVFSGPSGG